MNTLKEIFLQGFNGLTSGDIIFIFFQICSTLFLALAIKLFFYYTSKKDKNILQHPLVLHSLLVCALTCTVKFNAALAILAVPLILLQIRSVYAKTLRFQLMHGLAMAAALIVGAGSVVLALIFTVVFLVLAFFEKTE